MSHLKLMGSKRFSPLFFTQFFGAFTDNVFKQALIMLIVFSLASSSDASLWSNIAAGLFILPFFLFSGLAGELSEKIEKSKLIRCTKIAEIAIMVFGVAALYSGNPTFMVMVLFVMGLQSTIFGPTKYSILPQHLKSDEVIAGNGLMEMGTFIAILFGTMCGAYFINQENGIAFVSTILLLSSILGYVSSTKIPPAPATSPELKLGLNIFKQTKELFKITKGRPRSVYLSVIGISWFWFIGATFLTQLPTFVKTSLNGNETLVTLLLVGFSLGIGVGSLLCETMSRKKVELGIVPFGSIGITLFGVLLYCSIPDTASSVQLTASGFLETAYGWCVFLNIVMIGIFGGFYTVPLYSLIQTRTEKEYISRVVASNNMLNALFMVINAGVVMLLLGAGMSIPELFLTISVVNAIVSLYIYAQVPEFALRFVIWILTHSMYRVRHTGIDNLPADGPCVIASNHVSFFDALILGGAFTRPVRFVMFEPIYNIPVLNWFFRAVKAIPINSKDKNPVVYENAFKSIKELLDNGEVICIFPEGKITSDGLLNEFKGGIDKILKISPVPVLPCAISGFWGSLFSKKNKIKLPRLSWSKVEVLAGAVIQPEDFTVSDLREKITALRHGKAL